MRTSIFEHAQSLYDFDRAIHGSAYQIATHVIKIVHGRKLRYDLRSENHHKTELRAWCIKLQRMHHARNSPWCIKLQRMRLKSNADKYKRLHKHFVDGYEYCEYEMINGMAEDVFADAPVKIRQMLPISPRDSECISQVILELIRLMSEKYVGALVAYIEKL